MKKLAIILLGILFFNSCGGKKQVSISVSPKKPSPGSSLTISWEKSLSGYLWIQEFYGKLPVYRDIKILPIRKRNSFKVHPRPGTFLLIFTLEDTSLKKFYPEKKWQYVIFTDSSGAPDPRAFYALLNNDLISIDSIPKNLKNLCLLREFFAKENEKPVDLLKSKKQTCIFSGFKTAYTVNHDSTLSMKFYKNLRGPYKTYASLFMSSVSPNSRIRRDQKSADRFWKIFKSSPFSPEITKDVRLFRWFITRYFIPPDRFNEYKNYINSLSHLTMYDFYVMESQATWPEVDTIRLQFVLDKEKSIIDNPINSRWDYAFRLRKPGDYYRLKSSTRNDFLKNLTRLYIAKKKYSDAYRTIKEFVGQKDLFTLWDEDLILYGEAALYSNHLKEAEKALTVARFFHQDTSAIPLLKKIWKKEKTGETFNKYLSALKDTLSKWLPPAPDFTVATLDGKTYTLKKLRGKVVVLNFWATWCGPCRREIPELNKLVKKYGNSVIFLAFTDEDSARVRKFLKNQPFNYHIAIESSNVRKLYHVNAFPTHFIISPGGYIIFKQVGYIPGTAERLAYQIDKLLSKQLKE